MKTYKANNNVFLSFLVIFFLLIALIVSLIGTDYLVTNPSVFLPVLGPILYLIYSYVNTIYKISGDTLTYKSGLTKVEIAIPNIKTISNEKAKKHSLGLSMRNQGLTLEYDTYDKLSLNPIDKEALIADLIQINSKIKLVD